MLVQVIKPSVEYLGIKGTRRQIPDSEAQIHILLGNVIEVKVPHIEEEDDDEPVVVRKKRAYRRRDLRAEE